MIEPRNLPQPGDGIAFASESGAIVHGILAERAIGPLTGNPRYRVVDTFSEADDPDAGCWVDILHVLSFYPVFVTTEEAA